MWSLASRARARASRAQPPLKGGEVLASLSALLGADPVPLLWLLGGLKVATPGLEGGQVAVLRLHAAVSWLRNDCTILAELGERITQLQYFLQLSLRTS